MHHECTTQPTQSDKLIKPVTAALIRAAGGCLCICSTHVVSRSSRPHVDGDGMIFDNISQQHVLYCRFEDGGREHVAPKPETE